MANLHWVTIAASLALAGSAQAFDYFSVGPTLGPSPGDPGPAAFEFTAVTFDNPSAWFVTEQDNVPHQRLIFKGTTVDVAAAPAGDTTKYEAIAPNQSAVFSFGAVAPLINTISLYLGSIDAYNEIDLLDRNGKILGSIPGSSWPQDDGDEFAAGSNRRIYITNLPSSFWGIQFRSSGIAEEYDTIAVSSAIFFPPGGIPEGEVYGATPLPTSIPYIIPSSPPDAALHAFSLVPEPSAWVLLTLGVGGVGAMTRNVGRKRQRA